MNEQFTRRLLHVHRFEAPFNQRRRVRGRISWSVDSPALGYLVSVVHSVSSNVGKGTLSQ